MMLSRLVSSPRHVSVTAAAVIIRGLRFHPPVHVSVIGIAPRLFHTSSISRSGTEPDATPGRVRAQEPFKDAARQAAEEVSKMTQSVKDTVRPNQTATRGMTEEGATTHTRESVVNLIKKDHTNIGRLYRVYKNVTDNDTKLLMGQIIIREICIHSNAEEMEVYPVIDSDISHDQAEQARNDHASIESILKELDGLSTWDDTNDNRLNTAMQSLRRHIDFEESELLKLLESREKSERLLELGDSFADAKSSAPTRPHPMAPKKGVIAKAVKMATKPIDEVRDTIRFAGSDPDIEAERAETNTPPPV